MMRLSLDFIERRRLPWAGFAVLAITAGWGAQVTVDRIDLRVKVQRSQERVAALESSLKQQRQQITRDQNTMNPASEQRLKDEKKIWSSLNYPWNRVLLTIEQAKGSEVAILSFTHHQSTGQGQISVEALDFAALIRLVEKMNEGAEGRRWYVANYQIQAQPGAATVKAVILEK
jgi:hypothetical protein